MRAAKPPQLQSAINVTPLVDVVLVLLIVFMLVAPQMSAGPPIELPDTATPSPAEDETRQLVVAIAHGGDLWIDGAATSREQFTDRLREAAQLDGDRRVVLHGDARLSFGEVQQAMLDLEAAGFRDVRLVTERLAAPGA